MNSDLLKDKNILIGVTGSIAIYKTLELIRLFVKSGANVKVLMTKSSQRFITKLTFETISQNIVLDETSESWEKNSINNHINIGKWADIFLIAPISANSINKLANGVANNLLTQTVLAFTKKIVICPSANTNMLENVITKNSLVKLEEYGYKIIEPTSKLLACGDVGSGAMAEVEDIFYATAKELLNDKYWNNRDVIISGGGTVEKIDEVRYISNFSSGKMASNLALALYLKGANVKLIATRGYENLPKELEILKVQTSNEMFENLQNSIDDLNLIKKPYLFMVSAISDYLPKKARGKLKKESLGDIWDLKLTKNIDILNSLNKKELISIGFKAEFDVENAKKSAKNMLKNKKLDGVCLNILSEENPFGSNKNEIELFLKKIESSKIFRSDKFKLSIELLEYLQEVFSDR